MAGGNQRFGLENQHLRFANSSFSRPGREVGFRHGDSSDTGAGAANSGADTSRRLPGAGGGCGGGFYGWRTTHRARVLPDTGRTRRVSLRTAWVVTKPGRWGFWFGYI